MQLKLVLCAFIFCTSQLFAQPTAHKKNDGVKNYTVQGTLVDAKNNQPIEGASITLLPIGVITATNEAGYFHFKQNGDAAEKIEITAVGFEIKRIAVADLAIKKDIVLLPQQAQLMDVKVLGNAGDQYKPISKMDIRMRGVSNSQEVLRIVPGLFIGQHQGGGKAEQIFLRGFDCDHGTDISLNVDGMPI